MMEEDLLKEKKKDTKEGWELGTKEGKELPSVERFERERSGAPELPVLVSVSFSVISLNFALTGSHITLISDQERRYTS